jgi:hypothetical protein
MGTGGGGTCEECRDTSLGRRRGGKTTRGGDVPRRGGQKPGEGFLAPRGRRSRALTLYGVLECVQYSLSRERGLPVFLGKKGGSTTHYKTKRLRSGKTFSTKSKHIRVSSPPSHVTMQVNSSPCSKLPISTRRYRRSCGPPSSIVLQYGTYSGCRAVEIRCRQDGIPNDDCRRTWRGCWRVGGESRRGSRNHWYVAVTVHVCGRSAQSIQKVPRKKKVPLGPNFLQKKPGLLFGLLTCTWRCRFGLQRICLAS